MYVTSVQSQKATVFLSSCLCCYPGYCPQAAFQSLESHLGYTILFKIGVTSYLKKEFARETELLACNRGA